MLVVSNTSPISYLVVIEQIDLLSRLFECIFIPEVVRDELSAPKAPPAVRQWIASPPSWLIVQTNPLQNEPDLQRFRCRRTCSDFARGEFASRPHSAR